MTNPYRLPAEFETDRYHLRRLQADDAQAIFDGYATDEEVTRFLGWKPHQSIADTSMFLEIAKAEWDVGTGFPVVTFDQVSGELMGMFHPRVIDHRVIHGYVLRRSAWGRGCATEVMCWLVEHALGHPMVHRAEAFCDIDNHASARVMQKAGMEYEGILRRYFRHPNLSESPRDCMI